MTTNGNHSISPRLLAGLFLALIAISPPSPADGLDPDEVRALVKSGRILPFEQVRQRIAGKYPGRVQKVELEREGAGYVYEIRILDDKSGIVWKLEVDAATGQLLEARRRH